MAWRQAFSHCPGKFPSSNALSWASKCLEIFWEGGWEFQRKITRLRIIFDGTILSIRGCGRLPHSPHFRRRLLSDLCALAIISLNVLSACRFIHATIVDCHPSGWMWPPTPKNPRNTHHHPSFVACELLLAITWNCLVSQQSARNEGSLATHKKYKINHDGKSICILYSIRHWYEKVWIWYFKVVF